MCIIMTDVVGLCLYLAFMIILLLLTFYLPQTRCKCSSLQTGDVEHFIGRTSNNLSSGGGGAALKYNLIKCYVKAPGILLRSDRGPIPKHISFSRLGPRSTRGCGANPNILFIVKHKTMTLGFILRCSASACLFLPRYFALLKK